MLVLLSWTAVAQASYFLDPAPDYVAGVWFRVGVTSEGRFSFGVSGDFSPVSAGIEISPRSEIGLVRIFLVAKDSLRYPAYCSIFVGGSAGAVAAFGPGQKLHVGLRLASHVEHLPIALSGGPLSFPQVGEGVSYRFSWFPRVGFLHDGGVDLGVFWAPHGNCSWT